MLAKNEVKLFLEIHLHFVLRFLLHLEQVQCHEDLVISLVHILYANEFLRDKKLEKREEKKRKISELGKCIEDAK